MIVKKYSIKNQQKIAVGILSKGFYATFKWFHKFDSKKETIVKVELSSIDIEKVFAKSLFYKNGLTETEYSECLLEDIIDRNIFIPSKVTNTQLGHRILLKRKLTHDDLHIVIYCFKGTLKAINLLLKYNSLPWSSKANRTPFENKVISSAKYKRDIDFVTAKQALIENDDYEIIERIYNVEILEELLEEPEVPFKELIESRYIQFNESQDQDSNTYLDDYIW